MSTKKTDKAGFEMLQWESTSICYDKCEQKLPIAGTCVMLWKEPTLSTCDPYEELGY